MTSYEINERMAAFDENPEQDDRRRCVYGWYWRTVDFDAESVRLAHNYTEKPEWWDEVYTSQTKATQAAIFGKTADWREDYGVRFCQNNKWGYPTFRVEGDDWQALRAICETGTEADIYAFLQTLHPTKVAP